MNTILQSILARCKSRFGQAMLTVIVSTLILSYPWLIGWMDDVMKKWVLETAYAIRTLALPIIMMFAKGFNESGGTVGLTDEAKERILRQ